LQNQKAEKPYELTGFFFNIFLIIAFCNFLRYNIFAFLIRPYLIDNFFIVPLLAFPA